jgi:hypothetical protein
VRPHEIFDHTGSGRPNGHSRARAREKAAVEGGAPDQAKPNDKDQYNFTDPQSRIMPGSLVLWSGYGNKPAPKNVKEHCQGSMPPAYPSQVVPDSIPIFPRLLFHLAV